jgi:deferrochelatase/peroxidase EfeB
MGAEPVAEPQKRSNWRLNYPHDKFTQGLVVSGFADLESGVALFLEFTWEENGPAQANGPDGPAKGKGAWLAKLNEVAPITDAVKPATEAKGQKRSAAALAFTWTGLQKMGLGARALSTFSDPFREGMYQEDRLRRLGDRIKLEWQKTVIQGGPLWSANIPVRPNDATVSPDDGPPERDERPSPTPKTVHALLLLYDTDDAAALARATQVANVLAKQQVTVVHQLMLDLRIKNGVAREHFGFADGLSQPIPYDEKSGDERPRDSVVLIDDLPAKRDELHGVPLGEILIGHINAHHEIAPGPMVADDVEAAEAELAPDGAPEGFRNLGFDGSYLVVRELKQHVGAFWQSLEANAARIVAHDPSAANVVTADWLAERVVGRNIDGHLLCPARGRLPPADSSGYPQNDFRFFESDPHGLGCPLGSHVRRANPRDGLARDKGSAETLLDATNFHRILRRGRKYGTTLQNRTQDDNSDRGLLFMCLNTDIARQFEFIQQTWLLNPNFATLFDETDPLVGPKGRFTIPNDPLRRIVDVETFIQMAGGEYFFLPGMPALKYLAQL